jgi:hypothetical protein
MVTKAPLPSNKNGVHDGLCSHHEIFNDPIAPPKRQGREGYTGIKRNKIWQQFRLQ